MNIEIVGDGVQEELWSEELLPGFLLCCTVTDNLIWYTCGRVKLDDLEISLKRIKQNQTSLELKFAIAFDWRYQDLQNRYNASTMLQRELKGVTFHYHGCKGPSQLWNDVLWKHNSILRKLATVQSACWKIFIQDPEHPVLSRECIFELLKLSGSPNIMLITTGLFLFASSATVPSWRWCQQWWYWACCLDQWIWSEYGPLLTALEPKDESDCRYPVRSFGVCVVSSE